MHYFKEICPNFSSYIGLNGYDVHFSNGESVWCKDGQTLDAVLTALRYCGVHEKSTEQPSEAPSEASF